MSVTYGYDNILCRICTCQDYHFHYYIEFNTTEKEVYILDLPDHEDVDSYISEELYEKYPLGECLLSFLEFNFTEYNKKLYELSTNSHLCHSTYIQETFLDSFAPKDHPYFYTFTLFHPSQMTDESIYNSFYIDTKNLDNMKKLLLTLSSDNKSLTDFWDINNLQYQETSIFHAIEDIFEMSPLLEKPYFQTDVLTDKTLNRISIGKRYINTSPMAFCFTEFLKVLECGLRIKKCKNCNKLFVATTNHNVEYCSSCKNIGATKSYNKKVKQNPILKEYNKAYKRNYARIGKPGMSNEQFRNWVEEATQKRDSLIDKYLSEPSDSLIADFKKYLGNR